MWGKCRENGLWLASTSDWRFKWRGHDALYIALGRFRVRIMKFAFSTGQTAGKCDEG